MDKLTSVDQAFKALLAYNSHAVSRCIRLDTDNDMASTSFYRIIVYTPHALLIPDSMRVTSLRLCKYGYRLSITF